MPQIYHRIARIAAATAQSEAAFVTLRVDRKLCIIGTHGLYLGAKHAGWDHNGPAMIRVANITYIANVKRDENFRDHPLLAAAPYARNLVHVPVHGQRDDIEASISLANIGMKWPLNATIIGVLTELASLVGDAIEMDGAFPEAPSSSTPPRGFREARPSIDGPDPTIDTSGNFLVSTLLQKTSIRNRKDVGYITLRTWSKAIKDHQIKALIICKDNPAPQFVDAVANEITQQVRKILGGPRFGCVVPVPCGHSKRAECLSVQIAKRVAQLLEVPFVDALENVSRPGTSHPRKNPALLAPKLTTAQKFESVLVLDDVATSGRHIELSVVALRKIADHITAFAWIGPN